MRLDGLERPSPKYIFVTAHRQIEGEEPPIRLVRLRSTERRRDVPQRGYLRSPVGYDRWLRLATKTNAPPINMGRQATERSAEVSGR